MSAPQAKKRADMKVVIIGDAFVGKTTFIRRYMERTFSENLGTVGACFFLKQWKDYNVAIWDTAGEERFSGLSSFYCRDASAAIVAYDISNQRSFELLSERYLPLLDAAKEDCLLCITGMKLDIIDDKTREVDRCHAEKFAMQLNANRFKEDDTKKPYFETSSLTGENVDEVFDFIFSTLLPTDKDNSSIHRSGSQQSRGLIHVEDDDLQSGSEIRRSKNCCK
ncbi:ras-related protein Rab-20-like isoform X1 [Asterias rubens]|uniref:ras-related protein Rab-20-like isoform X1 n=2 Tax=Asterias rubens TaxID=7604 RepID=UPI0014554A61|nr:ras-related protein Rab-20-like isoform X1 [Asterias rubens]